MGTFEKHAVRARVCRCCCRSDAGRTRISKLVHSSCKALLKATTRKYNRLRQRPSHKILYQGILAVLQTAEKTWWIWRRLGYEGSDSHQEPKKKYGVAFRIRCVNLGEIAILTSCKMSLPNLRLLKLWIAKLHFWRKSIIAAQSTLRR